MSDIAIILVAAGSGTRANADEHSLPKQYRKIAGQSLLDHTVNSLLLGMPDAHIIPVISAEHISLFEATGSATSMGKPVMGGESRQASVFNGLRALENNPPDFVLIHDAARPFATPSLLAHMLTALSGGAQGVVPIVPSTDSLRTISGDTLGDPIDRTTVGSVQTPQGFPYPVILSAHKAAKQAERNDFTDDASLAEWHGTSLTAVAGDSANIKITHPGDFAVAEARLSSTQQFEYRTGIGYDVHRLKSGKALWLCGVELQHSHGLDGHSDADVALHALTDAVLGAIADGDIGVHFPPNDHQWRGARSDQFLSFAIDRVHQRGGRLVNLDLTIVAEQPKISPHAAAMRSKLSEISGLRENRISIKATTNERMGFAGREEGMAAYASATVALPIDD